MRKKLLMTYGVIIAITLIACGLAFWTRGYRFIDSQNQSFYLEQAEMLSDLYQVSEEDSQAFVLRYGERYGIRITVIDQEGNVTADSATDAALDRHDNREEVKKALRGHPSTAVRYSKTMKMEYLYSAVPLVAGQKEGVLRTSIPLEQLKVYDRSFILSIAGTLFIACISAFCLAYLFSRYITNPIDDVTRVAEDISSGNYGGKIYTRQDDQLGRLAESFNKMSFALKENIESLTSRNTELEAILGSMTNAVVAIDETNKVLFTNEAFRSLFQIQELDMKGEDIFALVRYSLLLNAIDEAREQGRACMQEGVIRMGQEHYLRIMSTPLHEEEYRTSGVLLVISDVTELKKLENMRSDFVSNVTHELKTPLTSIRGFVDTLKNGAINDEKVAKKFLDIIDLESERLSTLIEDILLLSEIENKKEYEMEGCEMESLLSQVAELLKPKTGEAVEILYHVEAGLEPYPCNPDRLKQLLINLADNAVKSTESGYVKLEAGKQDHNLILKVTDTGIGMPKEALDRIFERFYRVDKGRSRKQGGTGLGLSIVKHIVELYGGKIEVKSKINEGSQFIITLPYPL